MESLGLFAVDEETLRQKVGWADRIMVMENMHKKLILKVMGDSPEILRKIEVLDIPDVYDRNSPELIELLKKRFESRCHI